MRIYLEIPDNAGQTYRARLYYAFRLFCAIYGHVPIADAVGADVAVRYRGQYSKISRGDARTVWLSRGYRARKPNEPAPAPVTYDTEKINTVLHYKPVGEDAPDWLGEIFEWVSCADEYSVTERDAVGRLPFAATYMARYGLDVTKPYAGIAMRGLQQEICKAIPCAIEEPQRPCGAKHLVIPTHDVDYFPEGRLHAANRLLRNAAISILMARRPTLGLRQASIALQTVLGWKSDPLDQITAIVEEERRRGMRASYYFLVRHGHRLDAHYTLNSMGVTETISWLISRGMEVGIHASYTCMDSPYGLAHEIACLYARGFRPRGGRQHWLRFTLDRLISAVEIAGLAYDTSLGWPDQVGFRAGACFAFPPYDFEQERPATFLEIPMVIMDQALQMCRYAPGQMDEEAANLLKISREFGWGGISLLWHPAAFGEGWLTSEVGQIFWRLADKHQAGGDEWIAAEDFLAMSRQRYVDVGLLPQEEPVPAGKALMEEWMNTGTAEKRSCNRSQENPKGLVST